MREETIINGELYYRDDPNESWIPYSTEELTIMLQIERVNAERQYVKGSLEATEKANKLLKDLMDKLYPQAPK